MNKTYNLLLAKQAKRVGSCAVVSLFLAFGDPFRSISHLEWNPKIGKNVYAPLQIAPKVVWIITSKSGLENRVFLPWYWLIGLRLCKFMYI